jgi:hypothetical protein
LYFFPEVIPRIPRLLTPDGMFVVITHDTNNMAEMITVFKELLRRNQMLVQEHLPLEVILKRFSAENGMGLLEPWFATVTAKDYRNSLVFRPEDGREVLDYFLFKSPFLLSSAQVDPTSVAQLLCEHIQRASFLEDGFTMSKNDRIFICSSPAHERVAR